MVAFVMAYSFSEPTADDDNDSDDDEDEEGSQVMPPMMVPMADLLNHVTDNNAKLTFGTEALKMVTTRTIKKVNGWLLALTNQKLGFYHHLHVALQLYKLQFILFIFRNDIYTDKTHCQSVCLSHCLFVCWLLIFVFEVRAS